MIRYKLNPNESKIVIYDDNIKIIKMKYMMEDLILIGYKNLKERST